MRRGGEGKGRKGKREGHSSYQIHNNILPSVAS